MKDQLQAEIDGDIEVVEPRHVRHGLDLTEDSARIYDGFQDRYAVLTKSMAGFGGLISAVQCMLVGCSLDEGEIWETSDHQTTLAFAHARLADMAQMCEDWGVER